MIAYIIKSIICSALFWTVYKLMLENEKMHTFNRFYLLVSLVLSLVIPALTFTLELDSTPVYQIVAGQFDRITNGEAALIGFENKPELFIVDYIMYVIIGLYSIICFALLIRLASGLIKFRSKIAKSETREYHGITLVLSNETSTPYSFLKYIFISDESQLEDEIFSHELAHANQKHTLDKIFVELVQALWWFNPLLVLYKKAISANHEFLADESVLNKYNDVKRYQTLLVSNCANTSVAGIANQFNFKTTKKRLIMMTKSKSAGKILTKKIALLPILLCTIALFSTVNATKLFTQEISNVLKDNEVPSTNDGISKELMAKYHAITDKYSEIYEGVKAYNMSMMEKLSKEEIDFMRNVFIQMSKAQQNEQTFIFAYQDPIEEKIPSTAEISSWKNQEKYIIKIDQKEVDNSILGSHKNTDFISYHIILPGNSLNAETGLSNTKTIIDLTTKEWWNKEKNELLFGWIAGAVMQLQDGKKLLFPRGSDVPGSVTL